MKSLHTLFLTLFTIALIVPYSLTSAEGAFKWIDARGQVQYGDQPPANKKAKKMKMPAITVIEDYASQWKPMNFDDGQPEPEQKKKAPNLYSSLAFVAPKANQAIRANDGDVSAMLSIKPPLKKGHGIVFSLDGKEVAKGASRTNNFSNLPRGTHTVSAKIVDQKGQVLKNSSVTFNVQRFSKLLKKVAN